MGAGAADLAAVGIDLSEDNLHEGGFARAVGPHDCQAFAVADTQGEIAEEVIPSELFRDAGKIDHGEGRGPDAAGGGQGALMSSSNWDLSRGSSSPAFRTMMSRISSAASSFVFPGESRKAARSGGRAFWYSPRLR